MARIAWDEALSVGIQRIDEQHKKLIGYANRVLDAAHDRANDQLAKETLIKLREYTVYHFHDEEEYMAAIHYPDLPAHHNEHMLYVQRVKDLQREIYQGRSVRPEDLLPVLKDWLINHILKSDLRIAAHVRAQQEELKAEKDKVAGQDPSAPMN